jgi:tetratricopeptide (TPR) repeat protein
MTGNAVNHGKCLTDEILTEYLEGVLDPALKAASEVHLVGCDDCRVRLAFFMRLLKEEVSADEAVAVQSIQEEWGRGRGRQLPTRHANDRRTWRMASGSVAVALLLAVGTRVAMEYKSEPRTADDVIHLLLAEKRPFEGRISGQPHLPFATTRGPNDSTSSYNLLASQMVRLSATPYEMGQFHLLQRDFASAIRYLEPAALEPTASAEIHNDLGVAYMESRIPGNYAKAVNEFRRALAARADFLPAAFNLALAYEHMGKSELAEIQWSQYLQMESDREWKEEAKSKLEGIKH